MHSQGSILRYALALTMASLVALAGPTTALASHGSSSKTTSSATGATSRVDVNNANLKTLETLPGVSPTLAKKIVSGRPYSNLSDLAQVKGMGQTKANALKHHVTFGPASGATTTRSAKRTHSRTSSRSTGSYTTPAPGQAVDVNNAGLKTLETLPGVSPALAKKIVSGRPYSNLSDLAQVKGMGQTKANALKHHVAFGPASGATPAKSAKRTHARASSRSAGSYTTPSPTESTPSPAERSSSSEPSASSSHLAPGQTVDINTASAEELDKLPGIGPSKAQAIVDYRNEHGDFKSVEDIKNVHGIKEGTFSKIKDYITVGQ